MNYEHMKKLLLFVHYVIQSLCQPILTCFCSDHLLCTQDSMLLATVFVPENHFSTYVCRFARAGCLAHLLR